MDAEMVKRIEIETVRSPLVCGKCTTVSETFPEWSFRLVGPGNTVGFVTVGADGRFKVRVILQNGERRWLSSNDFMPLVPFDTFAEAKARLHQEILKEWS